MDNQTLKRYISKLNEDIRNIKYQINSIFQDIQKDKKQSYIEKRINRLTENYKELYKKYDLISGFDKEEIVKMQGVLMNIGEKVELVCQIGSKDIEKQNIKLDMWQEKNTNKNLVYVSEMKNDGVVNVYGKDGQLELVYVDNYSRKTAEKTQNKKEGFIKKVFSKGKEIFKNIFSKKTIRRIAAFGMGVLMLLPIGKAIGQKDTNNDPDNKKGSYTDNVDETPVDSHPFIEAFNKSEEKQPTSEIKSESETKPLIEDENENQKQSEEVHIIAPAQCKYTAVSDGSGEYGIFSEETEVAIYNRALIRANSDGTKSILKATKIGQTWEEYAEEQGLDYKEFKEYIENNENIQEIISTMSVDGKNIYGWIPASDLEYRTESKNIEVERSYVTEVEER